MEWSESEGPTGRCSRYLMFAGGGSRCGERAARSCAGSWLSAFDQPLSSIFPVDDPAKIRFCARGQMPSWLTPDMSFRVNGQALTRVWGRECGSLTATDRGLFGLWCASCALRRSFAVDIGARPRGTKLPGGVCARSAAVTFRAGSFRCQGGRCRPAGPSRQAF